MKKGTKEKRKRQTSVITIRLWLLLIATMVTIVTSNAINKEEDEIESDDWKISLVMYEDGGKDAKTDVTWNATSDSDAKQVTMQINYACTTGKEYAPGEIEITINGINTESYSEYHRSSIIKEVVPTIAADKSASSTKKYDWSYSYDSTTNTYTFTNNNTMIANEHFEGTIQIVYNFKPYFKIQTDLVFTAKMKENVTADEVIAMTSNTCNFHYTSTKKTYTLRKDAYTGDKAKGDFTKIEDILDDYYWVKYCFLVSSNKDGVIYALRPNDNDYITSVWGYDECIKETLPDGCVLYDGSLNKVEPVKENTYYYLKSSYSVYYYYYYVGYPKTQYNEGDSITNTAELWRTI